MKKLLLTGGLIFTLITNSFTQIIGGDAFIRGNYVEGGINTCGAFATTVIPPTGYHPNASGSKLSFVADSDMDGWLSGTPNRCGDYIIPGSPVEGWSLQFNGVTYTNTDQGCGLSNIPGDVDNYSNDGSAASVDWIGSIAGIEITQHSSIGINDLYALHEITIKNTTASTISNVYYKRNLDPDPEAVITAAGYTSINTVVSNPPLSGDALVTAVGEDYGCYIALGARNADAKVSYGNFSTTDGSPEEAYNGLAGYTTSGTNINDEAIQITFLIGDIAAGDSTVIAFAHIFDPTAEEAALAATDLNFVCNPPTSISTDVTTTSATLSWPAIVGAEGYSIKYRPTAGGTWTPLPLAVTPSATITDLTPCTSYTFKIFTTCDTSNSSTTVGTFTTECLPCTFAPSGLFTDNITTTTAKLNWTADPDAIKYKISYGPVGGPMTTINATSNFKNISGLTPGTTYNFKVRSVCGAGINSPFSTTSVFTTLLKMGEYNPGITIYPNPANDFVNINLQNLIPVPVTINIYDMVGNLVATQTAENAETNYSTQLSTINFASGMYILQVEQSGYKQIEQIIISK